MSLLPVANRAADMLMFLICLAIVLVAMGSYRSPAVALMPDLTRSFAGICILSDALCTMLFVMHGDSKPMKKKELIENFDTPD